MSLEQQSRIYRSEVDARIEELETERDEFQDEINDKQELLNRAQEACDEASNEDDTEALAECQLVVDDAQDDLDDAERCSCPSMAEAAQRDDGIPTIRKRARDRRPENREQDTPHAVREEPDRDKPHRAPNEWVEQMPEEVPARHGISEHARDALDTPGDPAHSGRGLAVGGAHIDA